ncbi:MAG: hypothetical protein ACXV8S_03150 [Methylobacter sp.]
MNIDGNEIKAKGLLLQAHDLLFKVYKISRPSSREHLLSASILSFLDKEQGASSVFTATELAVAKEFNGMNRREVAQKYRIAESDVYRILKKVADSKALESALKTLVDLALRRSLSDSQIHVLVLLLNELGRSDSVRQIRSACLSARQSCAGGRGRLGMVPRLRLALDILGLQAVLQRLVLGCRRVRSWVCLWVG